MHQLTAVCVFCGSTLGSNPVYAEAAAATGRLLAEDRIRLVYGGASVGLMGTMADAALAAGGEVVGVIPRGLFREEVGHAGVTKLIEVGSMHERKKTMFELSDAFVALPGGLGTFEELLEIVTWAHLGIHDKPIATLDVAGYWRPLDALIDHAAATGFVAPAKLRLIARVERPEELIPRLRSYQVVHQAPAMGLAET
jgi:uncharacterized protein (TIGR00730 family)